MLAETMQMHAAAMPPLPIEVRIALEEIVRRCADQSGTIRAFIIGDDYLCRQFDRYAPIEATPSTLIALAPAREQVESTLLAAQPARVLLLCAGTLARLLKPVRATPMSISADPLTIENWQSAGYARSAQFSTFGIGSLVWSASQQLLQRGGRPDLADRCRITMLQTMTTSRLTSRFGLVQVREYRRVR